LRRPDFVAEASATQGELELMDNSIDKIHAVYSRMWLLMITSSAEVGAGRGRGARKLGNCELGSHQSGSLQLWQHLTQ